MPPKKKSDSLSLDDMLGLLQAGIGNKKPNNLQYEPHDKQVIFHNSNKHGRQFLGGNRSGKTVAGINEDVWWLTGRHPFLRLPDPPIIGRIVTVNFNDGAEAIIIPQLKQWLAPTDLINGSWEDSYNGKLHVLTLSNGSSVEIKSHEQALETFAGVPRHFTHFDEECPEDIFKECDARLTDYNGRWWMTMTPVDGMTWTYEKIYNEGRGTDNIDVIEVNQWDNPHLNAEGLTTTLQGYDEDEMEIRGKGHYINRAGMVFGKDFSDENIIKILESTT